MNGESISVEIGMKPSPQEETVLNAIDLGWALYRMLIDEILLHVVRNPLSAAISVRLLVRSATYKQVNVLPCNNMRCIHSNIAELAIV